MLIPQYYFGGSSEYASLSDAQTAITDSVHDCYVAAEAVATITATPTANGIDISLTASTTGCRFAIDAKAGTLSDAFSGSGGGTITLQLYDTSGTLLDSDSSTATSGTLSVSIPADGIYVVRVGGGAVPGPPPSPTHSITNSDTLVLLPVIALWDDSGTTRQLEACPKMLLPPLTESTGTWYASCASASSDISSNSSNCVGYVESVSGLSSFTATDGGTSLALAQVFVSSPSSGSKMWGSINAEAASTFAVALGGIFSGLPPSASFVVDIYDYMGTLVETSGSVGITTWISSALPYTGRYIVSVVGGGGNATAVTGTFTSSGTMSVNQIQSLYDIGLDCSGRLNCGDSCP